jgi:SAM-dependent methyltransferase
MPAVVDRVRHMRRMWALFKNEPTDPEPFYRAMAVSTADELEQRHPIAGTRILDAGCGPGWYVEELRHRDATVIGLDGDQAALTLRTPPTPGLLRCDAAAMPFEDNSFDGVFCSNLLEHASDTNGVLNELARVLRPSGWGYLSWTNWYSPHGGHDMNPYQYLGPNWGPKLYERRNGPPRTCRYGEGLFAVHIGPTLKKMRAVPNVEITRVEPRYWPQFRFICSLPGAREVLTWNCVIHFTKTGG